MAVIGQLVTPQNRAAIPAAADSPGDNPSRLPATHPNVAPMLNAGTISPPRYPARIVSDVRIIFHRKSSGRA